ncbi:response regulator [Paenibacillus agaridevorans]|nr:response regulator [Paenibacillus agaridevorans]
MYRMLIVDDEPAIVDGLMQYFQDEESLELDLCKAYSAEEALNIIERTKLDLIISDIRMPGKNGIQLADDLLLYWPNCRIIFLTGYSDFDYAHKAIRRQVENYILKTEGIATIHKAVVETIAKIRKEEQSRYHIEHAKLQLTAAEPLLKRELFEDLLIGEVDAERWNGAEYSQLSIQIDSAKPMVMVAGKVDLWEQRHSHTERMEIFYGVQKLFSEQLSGICRLETLIHDRNELLWFIQPGEESRLFVDSEGRINWHGIMDYLKGILEPVQIGCWNELGISISFVLCNGLVTQGNIIAQVEAMRAAFKKRAMNGQSMAIMDLRMDETGKQEGAAKLPVYSTDFDKKLIQLERCIETGDNAAVREQAAQLLDLLRRDFVNNYILGLERCYRLLSAYLSILNNLQSDDSYLKEQQLALLPSPELLEDWGAFASRLLDLGETICKWKQEHVEKSEHLLIERIHRFIGAHLGSDLSLARIAEVVFFNPAYLSRFYKKVTGRNLSDYINEVRAKAAVEMLTRTQLKVNEIGLKLGFESPSYFTAFFRKMTGATPQEYREMVIRSGK